MRFSLEFELKDKIIPMEIRKIVISFIKNAISKANDGKYYEEVFGSVNQKDYCFTIKLPKAKYNKEDIELEENRMKISFSTNDENKLGFILYSAFISQKNKEYPMPYGNVMNLKKITNDKTEEILSSRVIFKTSIGSGICVRDHNKETNKDNYLLFNDSEFREKLNVVLSNRLLKSGFTEKEVNEIKVNPINCKKVVVKHYRRYIDTSVGMFEVQGNPNVLQYLYNVGLGSRTGMGFGMVDLVTQDLI